MSRSEAEGRRPRARVADVAKAAGVSVATVSRCFTMPAVVSDQVRRRVMEQARLLEYTPHPAARALRSRKTHLVGVVIPTLDYAIYARLVNTFQDTLNRAGLFVLVSTSGFNPALVVEQARRLVGRGAEALLIVGQVNDEEFVRFLGDRNIPSVATYTYNPRSLLPTIGFDNYAAIEQVMRHVTALGHREIVFLCGPLTGNDRQQARLKAFIDHMDARGLERAGRVIECEYTLERGAEAMRAVHQELPGTTCIVCTTDALAFGVLVECRKLGLRVPADITVTGFDDQDYAALLDPPLTTINIPAHQMGQRAAEAIIHAQRSGSPIGPVLLETRLILRSSADRPRPDRHLLTPGRGHLVPGRITVAAADPSLPP